MVKALCIVIIPRRLTIRTTLTVIVLHCILLFNALQHSPQLLILYDIEGLLILLGLHGLQGPTTAIVQLLLGLLGVVEILLCELFSVISSLSIPILVVNRI